MNHFETTILGRLLEPALSLRLTLTLLHFLWQGALLGLAAFAADRGLRRASSRTRYAVFVSILAAMSAALPTTFLLIRIAEPQSNLATVLVSTSVPVVMTNSSPAVTPRPIGKASQPVNSIQDRQPEPISDLGPAGAFIESPAAPNEPPTARLKPYATAVTLTYLAGIVLMLARLAVALQGGRRLRLAATPISEGPITELVRRQAQQIGLKTAPLVAWCSRISVPVVVGIVRPMILLPGALATGFDPSQLEALLTHELAHIRRFDPLVNLLQRLIEVLLFFHPAVWFVSRRVSAERENACDDLVLSAGWPAVRYAEALLQMAEFSAAARGLSPQSNAALAASGGGSSQFKRRVLRLLEIEDAPHLRLSRSASAILVAAAVLIFSTPTLIRAVANKNEKTSMGQQQEQPGERNPRTTLPRVLAAWKERQDRVKSFEFVWDTRITAPPGYGFPPNMWLLADLGSAGADVGDKGLDFTIKQSMWRGEGDRYRDDFSRVNLFGPNDFRETLRIIAIRSGDRYCLVTLPTDAHVRPWLTIWRKAAIKNPAPARSLSGSMALTLRQVDLAPLRLAVRPLVQPPFNSAPFLYNTLAWTPDNCRVVGENAIVGNVHCIKLEQNRNNHFESCWVDPKREYVVVHWERHEDDGPTKSVSIDYRQDPEYGWLPSHWRCEVTGTHAGKRAAVDATVTHYSINRELPSDTCADVSPPGTQVYDVTVNPPPNGLHDAAGAKESEEDRRTLEAITAAWSARQRRVKSFKFAWQTEKTMASWLADQPASPLERAGARARPAAPFVLLKDDHSFCVDGERLALRTIPRSPLPAGTLGEWRAAFDGTTLRSLANYGRKEPRASGKVQSAAHFDIDLTDRPGITPLLLVYRPLASKLGGIELSKYHMLLGGGKIDGTTCVIIASEERPGTRRIFWLDPAREYVILREQQSSNGQDFNRLDYSYRNDPKVGWVFSGWNRCMIGDGGSLLMAITATVTTASINEPLPLSDFQFEFPPGTRIEN